MVRVSISGRVSVVSVVVSFPFVPLLLVAPVGNTIVPPSTVVPPS